MPKVLFSTNTYEKDYKYLSKGGFDDKYLLCDYPFEEKWIVLHRVENGFDTADMVLERKRHGKAVLDIFELTPDCFVDPLTGIDGYIYSIDSLIDFLFKEQFDYICHFCGDVELKHKADWITEGIEKIKQGYFGARPRLPIYTGEEKPVLETDVFSDHVYLLPTSVAKWFPAIFKLKEPSCSPPHPEYGGDSFERKMTRWLQATHQKMAVIQNAEEVPCLLV
jgi:hypothetical protein